MPNWETTLWGHTISWNVLIPGAVVLGVIINLMLIYPWLEAKVTGDKREHHLLDRPRNAPTRTGIGVMSLTFYMMLLIGGGNDIIASQFNLSINAITWAIRIGIFILPPISFVITKRICLSLQRRDRDKLLHGRETGSIMRLPEGAFVEVHAPLSDNEKAVILSKTDITPSPGPRRWTKTASRIRSTRRITAGPVCRTGSSATTCRSRPQQNLPRQKHTSVTARPKELQLSHTANSWSQKVAYCTTRARSRQRRNQSPSSS